MRISNDPGNAGLGRRLYLPALLCAGARAPHLPRLLAAARIWLLLVQAAFALRCFSCFAFHPEADARRRRLLLLAAFGFMPVYLKRQVSASRDRLVALITATLSGPRCDAAPVLPVASSARPASLKVSPIFLIPLFARLGRWRIALSGSVMAHPPDGRDDAGGTRQLAVLHRRAPPHRLGTATGTTDRSTDCEPLRGNRRPNLFGSGTQTLAKVVIAGAALAVIGVTLWYAAQGAQESWTLRLSVSALVTALLI